MSRFLLNGYDLYGNAPQAGGGFAPIGTIISYMGTTAPQDYLICDGTAYNIADYKQLADFIKDQFGSYNFFGGNGTTTFAVPDLRGEFLRGTGTNSHTNQGSGGNVGVHQDATQHLNIASSDSGSFSFPYMTGATYWDNVPNRDSKIGTSSNNYYGTASIGGNNRGTWYTSRPTNTSVLYCIKAVCAGDVYSTSERVVGTWIDGKPVYQKTVEVTSDFTDKIVIQNIDMPISYSGIVIMPTVINIVPYPAWSGDPSNVPSVVANWTISGYFDDNKQFGALIGLNVQSSVQKIIWTFSYTKTTD